MTMNAAECGLRGQLSLGFRRIRRAAHICLGITLLHTQALQIELSQIVLRSGMSAVRGFPVPACGLGIVLVHPAVDLIGHARQKPRITITRLRIAQNP